MLIVSIDPGVSGAIGLHDLRERRQEVRDMPLVAPPKVVDNKVARGRKKKKKKKSTTLVCGRGLTKMLRGLDPAETVVVIEKVGVMTGKEGRVSMFNFGNSAGVVRGVCEALGFRTVFVDPREWKKALGLIGTEKAASRLKALALYPSLAADLKPLVKGVGRADALLIGEWYKTTQTVH